MKITISATGNLRSYIPEAREIKLDGPISLNELKTLAGIPDTKTVSYAVNGRVKKGDYAVAESDHVKFLMLVGAG